MGTVSISRLARLICSVALSVVAILGFAPNAPAATATLTLNPNHGIANPPATFYFNATLYVDTCFTGVTADLFLLGLAPVAAIVDPPCSGQTMTVFFSHVYGPEPTPGNYTYAGGLWPDSDIHYLHGIVSAQAVYRVHPQPPPPSPNPAAPLPPGHIGPPAGPPPATAAPSPPPPPVSPTATPCPVLTAAINQVSTSPKVPLPQFGLMLLAAVLLVTTLPGLRIRRINAAGVVVVILIAVVTLSCGRFPLNAASETPSPSASELAPTLSPTC